jgi:hypothetical protein
VFGLFAAGLGYANVENRVPCSGDTVMRIASISKSMTMAIAGKLMEQGKLDLDKPVQHYVKEWPDKEFEGEKVCRVSGTSSHNPLSMMICVIINLFISYACVAHSFSYVCLQVEWTNISYISLSLSLIPILLFIRSITCFLQVDLTTRQLVSHKGGLRHYDRNCGDLYQPNKEDQVCLCRNQCPWVLTMHIGTKMQFNH